MLVAVWMLMLNSFSFGGLLLALSFGITIPIFTAPFWPDRPRLRFGWAMIDYLGVVLWDIVVANFHVARLILRSEEHTSDLQSLISISYAVFCLKNNHHQPLPST